MCVKKRLALFVVSFYDANVTGIIYSNVDKPVLDFAVRTPDALVLLDRIVCRANA